jgi:IS30 family transposase
MSKIKTYEHLSDAKRVNLQALFLEGHNQKTCAEILHVSESTISRERKRYSTENGTYEGENAIHKASISRSNSKYQGYKIEKNNDLRKYIITHLKEKRSPDEIAGRMKKDKEAFYASKNAIYTWLWSPYGQAYCKYLCTKRYNPKPQKKDGQKRFMIPNLVSYELAPFGSLNKTRYGHGEVDTMVSPRASVEKGSLAVVTLKKEKLLRIKRIDNMKPESMSTAVKEITESTHILSLIGDRGIENKKHHLFGVPTFFCDPHSPWQKPHVENQNGLLRKWWFPKGTVWANVSDERIQKAEDHLNNKWRKSLGYLSANEVSLKCGTLERV